MDTLSSSVSAIKVAALHSTPRELHHLNAYPITCHQFHPHYSSHLTSSSSTTRPNKTANSSTRKSFTYASLTFSGTSVPKSTSPNSHQKPASGYAAALLDKAQCHGSLKAVQKDVQQLLKLLKNEQIQALFADPFVGEKEKGQIVKEVVSSIGKVNRYLAGLLRMLIERNKVAMVSEVLEEFERIYDELIGTRIVFVSSVKKMEEDEILVIAKSVQKLSGAAQAKIRNLVEEGLLPSFAV